MNTKTDLAGRLRERRAQFRSASRSAYFNTYDDDLMREAAEALSTSSDARVGVKARRLLDLLRTDGDPAALIIPDFKDDEHQQAYIEAYDDLTRALAPASSGEREPDYHERHQIMEMAEAASPEKDEPAGDTRLVEAACEVWRRIRHWDAGDRGEPVGIIQDVLRDFGLSTSPPSLDPTPPNWEDREWNDNAEDVAAKIIAVALSEKPTHASDAWRIVKKWLADYAEEEATFSSYRDDVMLDGVMTAGLMRKLNAALAFHCCKGLAPPGECGCASGFDGPTGAE